ncbi:MAG: MFS transporter, partial [Lentisphaeraceae bacterium]|nr:MFS transporter [Lentisphaeraceae bacterium]
MFKEKRFYGVALSYTLGVFNDNAFKTAVIYLVTHHLLLLRFGPNPSGAEAEAIDLSLNSEISVYFFLPFVLFATVAGWACDRFSRSKILKMSKFSEVIVMSVGAFALYKFQTEPQTYHLVLLAAVFAMALQSTFFSPARNGIIPQLFSERESSDANGKIEMMQFMGIIFGIAASAVALRSPAFLILFPGIALLGYLFSMQIPKVPAENPQLKFNWNVFGDLFSGTKSIFKNRPLTHCILGQAYFYALGVVLIACIMNITKFSYGLTEQAAVETQTSIMLATLSIGMGLGCFMAGKLSRGRIELGLVPIGMAGMIVFILMFSYNTNLKLAYLQLALLGIFSGFFILPLKVYIQQRSDKKERGKILAIDNFISFAFMLAASYFVYKGTLAGVLEDSRVVLRYCVVVSVFVALTAFYLLPEFVVRFILVCITRTIYKMDVTGEHKIPEQGPVLLLPNHVTWMDGFMITAATSRPVKFMISDMYYNVWFLKPFFKWAGFIPVPEAKGKKAIVACLTAARDALEDGEVVCIFPEGQLTRSGVMSEFKTGFTRMLPKRDDLTIIPMYLGMAWGSMFSFKYGKNIRPRIPTKFPYPLDIRFGDPLPLDIDPQGARRAVREMENAVESQSFEDEKTLHYSFFKYAKRHPIQSILRDSEGEPVKNISVLMRALTLRNWIKESEKEDEK